MPIGLQQLKVADFFSHGFTAPSVLLASAGLPQVTDEPCTEAESRSIPGGKTGQLHAVAFRIRHTPRGRHCGVETQSANDLGIHCTIVVIRFAIGVGEKSDPLLYQGLQELLAVADLPEGLFRIQPGKNRVRDGVSANQHTRTTHAPHLLRSQHQIRGQVGASYCSDVINCLQACSSGSRYLTSFRMLMIACRMATSDFNSCTPSP
jgi:hypothetical protein